MPALHPRDLSKAPPPVDGAVWLPLAGERFALIDPEDFEWAMQYNWALNHGRSNKRYVVRANPSGIKPKTPSLHRDLMNPPVGMQVDHINGNPLDNRKTNLRICTRHQNVMNNSKRSGTHSIYKGVGFNKSSKRNPWTAHIRFNNITTHLGVFPTQELAAARYDQEATKVFGAFAKLNFGCYVEKK